MTPIQEHLEALANVRHAEAARDRIDYRETALSEGHDSDCARVSGFAFCNCSLLDEPDLQDHLREAGQRYADMDREER